jgi:glutamate-1-semialdehyde 2,1-aminomutase
MSERYRKSEEMLKRALSAMPLGTQTFSKSRTQYPLGVSPYFVTKAKGSKCWDVDGNEYLDFINGLCAVTLGYNDADVTEAVKAQLENGVIFSLPHPLEVEVAEKIIEMVPCAETVRFGKNGSDATAGAIRIARAFTHRDHVAACGYHGWQDWYIGATTRNLGVPESTGKMTHLFTYNDPDSLLKIFREHPDGVAAVIMEPMNVFEPKDDFLHVVREIAHKYGAVLIFDETITGFRCANGGAQELFGVMPDLATFGKGLANGYPLSAVTGRADIMQLMEEVFFSFTFGGETLSLAASLATMSKLQREPVVKTLVSTGEKIIAGLRGLIAKHNAQHFLSVAGNPTWSFLMIEDTDEYPQYAIKTLFLQEMFVRNILMLSTHNVSYAHTQADIDCLLKAYDEVLPILGNAVDNHCLKELLHCEPLKPLFKVR